MPNVIEGLFGSRLVATVELGQAIDAVPLVDQVLKSAKLPDRNLGHAPIVGQHGLNVDRVDGERTHPATAQQLRPDF